MALDKFIPQLWSARLLSNLNAAHVYAALCNRDYEGEISDVGDTVKISSIGRVTTFKYNKNTDMPAPETLTDAQRLLTITESQAFNFQVDDIDKAQQTPKVMGEAMQEAGYSLSSDNDAFIAGKYIDAGITAGFGSDAVPLSITTADAGYNYLVDLAAAMDDAKVPKGTRWVVLPTWYKALFLKVGTNNRFVDLSDTTSRSLLERGLPAQGLIGEIAGFAAYASLNVPNTAGAKFKVMAGYRQTLSYAEQIVKVEAYRPEKRFADAVKGLHVYGAKTVRPETLACMTVNRT
jgi:hypothetical protein